jgi:glycerol-3-phosphate dehydrogenase
VSYIGTTDDDYYGDLDDVRATTDEVRYLLQAVGRLVPSVRDARVIGTTAGVRPTRGGWGMYEDDLPHDHEIVDHGERDGIAGFYSMIGGKLASFRLFAEETTDVVCAALGVTSARCRTHEVPLPGGEATADPAHLALHFGVPEPAAARLVYRHGARAHLVLERTDRRAGERAVVCACEPVLECEVRHACREEGARTLPDVLRRTRLGTGACGAMKCAHRAAQIVSEENGYGAVEAHQMAAAFLEDRFRSRLPGLDGVQLIQEELLAARMFAAGVRRRDGGSIGQA